MTTKQWCFEPFDTWFFRESRPLDTISGTELSSLFPPPARTILGAIRSLIGENKQVNWKNYHPKKYPDLYKEIGGPDDDDFGQLELKGPFLIYQEQRLYPVPLFLMEKEGHFHYLQIGKPVDCDLGKQVRLPKLEEPGAKPLDKAWITECGLKKVLKGELPDNSAHDIIRQPKLFQPEPRLGIARDKNSRTIQEGLLYQSQHLRMTQDIKIGAIVKGIREDLHPSTKERTRFGGEGRLASVEVTDHILSPPKVQNIPSKGHNLLLMLLTPADLGCEKESWLPTPHFKKVERQINGKSCTVWEVNLNGVELSIISAVLGKAIREGGWNLRKHCPRPLKSLVPAGSVWFCKVKDDLGSAIDKLQGVQVGNETALGRGELIAGIWG